MKVKIFLRMFSEKIKTDPYLVLEINHKAEWKSIKIAYFKLARIYHPDMNKNDERANKKFLQIKEAYEYFDRKYNPDKYANVRMPINKFDEGKEEKKEEDEKPFESIRETNKYTSFRKHDFVFKFDEADNEEKVREKIELELKKQEYIKDFLFVKAPVPRSERMIDRLKLKEITIGKGRLFGPDDYMGLTILTLFILIIFSTRMKQYETYTFENLQNVNIYNALKPSEVNKIYSDNEMSPVEQVVIDSKEHQKYSTDENKQKFIIQQKMNTLKPINDVPKVDLKKKFKENI